MSNIEIKPTSENFAKMTVRARAVDMLGRQQIAGIPSAVHELFKNAYDAFAQRVEVDVIRSHSIFLLRDDGYGMTKDDFTGRWLTIGTESKVGRLEATAPWLGPHGKIPRRVLGEKGIGRLAIAVIGPCALILTRAHRSDGLKDVVVALIHWGLFEIPGLDLNALSIPTRIVNGGGLPQQSDVEEMVGDLLSQVDQLKHLMSEQVLHTIKDDLNGMRFSPSAVYAGIDLQVGDQSKISPSLLEDGHGTHFFIKPYNNVLELDLEEEGSYPETRPSKLQTMLAGFSNTMFPNVAPPPIHASFRDHRGSGDVRDLIDEQAFLTPSDYNSADHLIEGAFDKYGQFTGTVQIYGQPPQPYTLSYPRNSDSPLRCGPFKVRFGYSQGWAHQSLLDSEQHALLSRKLSKFGGLYVYRDGIRVLPYGDIEHDFLRIEQRRTKAAKDWFFSFRRMFGAILIDVVNNGALQEKAGREGFQENVAFRQFRDVLESFLMTLAKDFFRKDAPLGEQYNHMRQQMDAQAEVLRKREKLQSSKKNKLQLAIEVFFSQVDAGRPKLDAETLRKEIDSRFDEMLQSADADEMGRALQSAESDLSRKIETIQRQYRISRPRGIALSKSNEADWVRHRMLRDEIELEIFGRVKSHLDARISELLRRRGEAIDRRLLLRQTFYAKKEIALTQVRDRERAARRGLEQAHEEVRAGIQESFSRFNLDVETALSDFERTNLSNFDDDAIVDLRTRIQSQIDRAASREAEFLGNLREQLETLTESVKAGYLPDDVSAALEGQNVTLREELDEAMYWAQIGMAIGVVQHEFDAVARQVKKGIRSLKPWADRNPALRELFLGLHSGFAHLEDYLRLFSALDRRLHRNKMTLLGSEIAGYLRNVFDDRFERHNVNFKCSGEFLSSEFYLVPSTIYPVLINLFENACYWLSIQGAEERLILLDSTSEGISVVNTGPGIEVRVAERIFEFGFSEKPNGRGMGLAIARRALKRDGLDLFLKNPGKHNNPEFLILIPNDINSSVGEVEKDEQDDFE